MSDDTATGDPFDLDRFTRAQERDYGRALAEIERGQKRTHWTWYIFPQIGGPGYSPVAKRYAVKGAAEAYLRHPVLGLRLTWCAEAALRVQGRSARDVFGSPDDLKLRSSATLFAAVSPAGSVFHRLLDHYFRGEPDSMTLSILGSR